MHLSVALIIRIGELHPLVNCVHEQFEQLLEEVILRCFFRIGKAALSCGNTKKRSESL